MHDQDTRKVPSEPVASRRRSSKPSLFLARPPVALLNPLLEHRPCHHRATSTCSCSATASWEPLTSGWHLAIVTDMWIKLSQVGNFTGTTLSLGIRPQKKGQNGKEWFSARLKLYYDLNPYSCIHFDLCLLDMKS